MNYDRPSTNWRFIHRAAQKKGRQSKFEPSASYRVRRQHSITEDLMDVVTSFAVTVAGKDMLQLVV